MSEAMSNPLKLFISYSHDNEAHKTKVLSLVNQLRVDGYDATLDLAVDPPEGWSVWMHQQLDNADFVLIICTEIYQKRVLQDPEEEQGNGVKFEGKIVLNKIQKAGGKNHKFIPVLIDETSIAVIPDILSADTRIHINTQSGEGYEQLRRKLDGNNTVALKLIGKHKPLPKLPGASPMLVDTSPSTNSTSPSTKNASPLASKNPSHQANVLTAVPPVCPEFVGRERELVALTEAVNNEDAKHLVLLCGIGGIGKSTTCAKWFRSTAMRLFDHLAWISCKDGIANGLAESEIYPTLGIDDDPQKLLHAISQFPGSTLFVLDDIRQPKDELLKGFKNIGHPGFRLITTSRLKLPGFKEQAIGVLSPELCLELFQQFYEAELCSQTKEVIEQLIEKAGRHTLTIELIAKTMSANDLQPRQMLAALEEHGFDLSHTVPEAADFTKDGEEYSEVLNDALRSLFDIAELEEQHQFILFLLGHFNGAQFVKSKVKDWFLLDGLKELNDLEKLGWLTKAETKNEVTFYHLHPVISDVARQIFDAQSKTKGEPIAEKVLLEDKIPEEQLNAYLKQIIDSLSKENFNDRYPGDFHLLQPLQQFYSYIKHPTETLALALNHTAFEFHKHASYQQALPLFQRALAIHEKVLGAEHPAVATSLNNLAALYKEMGDYQQALPLHQRALAIHEKVLGAEHPAVATSLNNLAGLYKAKGDYPQALPLYQRALAIREKVLEAEHPNVAQSLNNLSGLYIAMGDYPQALPLLQRALAIIEKVLGTTHPNVATSLNNLSELYKAMDDYPQALPLQQRALAIREKVLGAEHPDVAQSLNNLAGLYIAMGDYPQALPLFARCLKIFADKLGKAHPHTKTVANNFLICVQKFMEKLQNGEMEEQTSEFDMQSLLPTIDLVEEIL